MPAGTTYKPLRASELDSNKVNLNAQGATGPVTIGSNGNIDLLLADDCLLTGLVFFTDLSAAFGDWVKFQVVDVSGIMSPPGTVLLQPANPWYVCPGQMVQMDTQYPAKVYAGLTLRIVYNSVGVGIGNVNAYINYKLHKCLV